VSALLNEPTTVAEVRRRSLLGTVWDVVRQRPSAAVGAILLGTFVLIALFAPALAPYGVHEQVGPVYAPPSAEHWLGLDDGGIDMVSLLIYGGRISLVVGFAAAVVATVIGGGVGIVAGYFGGATDGILMRITDCFLVIPEVPLMIVVATIWGPSLSHIIIVIGILLWTSTARIVRAQVKSVRERVYVKRARSLGAGNSRLILRHVLPQIAPLLIANVVLTVAVAIFDETTLAFLGLSDPSAVSWGSIIQHGFERTAISNGAWWAIVPPGICVALVIMGCYLLGQAIEDALNPRLKVAHLSVKGFRLRPLVGRGSEAL
jgi:peptide/nickel transport system permease protein